MAEYDCEVRRRLGEMMPGDGELWWSLDADPVTVAADVRRAVEDYGLPFLDSTTSRDLIIHAWHQTGDSIGFPPRGALAIALLHRERGEIDVAAQMVRRYLADEVVPEHRDYVEKLVAPLGLSTDNTAA